MIREYIDDWLEPSEDIVYLMDSNLRTQLSELVHDTFKKYIPGGLHGLIGYVHYHLAVSETHPVDRSIVEECLDRLKDKCLHRIREAFDREKSITATLQTRRFEAYRDIYEEYYTAMYQQHAEPDDILSSIGEVVEGFVEKKLEEMVPGFGQVKNILQKPNRQDIMGMMRMKTHPTEGRNKAAIQIMAEVRSYYDCK